MKRKSDPKAPEPVSFVLGRARFEQISAVEGIVTAPDTVRMFAEFDRTATGAQQRRAVVAAKFSQRA